MSRRRKFTKKITKLVTEKKLFMDWRRKRKNLRNSSSFLITRLRSWRETLLLEKLKSANSKSKQMRWTTSFAHSTRSTVSLVSQSMSFVNARKRCKNWLKTVVPKSARTKSTFKVSKMLFTGSCSTLMTTNNLNALLITAFTSMWETKKWRTWKLTLTLKRSTLTRRSIWKVLSSRWRNV